MKDDNIIKVAIAASIAYVIVYFAIISILLYLGYRVLEHQNWI